MSAVAAERPRAVAARRAPLVEGLFFATVFTVTFAKLQWEVAGTMSFSDVATFVFLIAFAVYRIERFDGSFPRAAAVTIGVLPRLPPRLPDRLVQPRDRAVARPVDEGDDQVPPPLPLPHRGRDADRAPRAPLLLAHAGGVRRRHRGERRVRPRCSSPSPRRPAPTSTRPGCSRSRAATARSTSSARSRARSSTASTR